MTPGGSAYTQNIDLRYSKRADSSPHNLDGSRVRKESRAVEMISIVDGVALVVLTSKEEVPRSRRPGICPRAEKKYICDNLNRRPLDAATYLDIRHRGILLGCESERVRESRETAKMRRRRSVTAKGKGSAVLIQMEAALNTVMAVARDGNALGRICSEATTGA